jgi:hypothetical protein
MMKPATSSQKKSMPTLPKDSKDSSTTKSKGKGSQPEVSKKSLVEVKEKTGSQ